MIWYGMVWYTIIVMYNNIKYDSIRYTEITVIQRKILRYENITIAAIIALSAIAVRFIGDVCNLEIFIQMSDALEAYALRHYTV